MCQTSENNAQTEYHHPVMLDECVKGLAIHPDGIYVDATFGGGGHSRAVLNCLGPDGRLIAFDQDIDASANSIDDPRFLLIQENFSHLKNFLRMYGFSRIDGLLADLGVSSHQFDEASRGFSTRFDGPLDLRMDRRNGQTAADIVNTLTAEQLQQILFLYGELPNAKVLAADIVAARGEKAITTTFDLRKAVERHLPRNRENKTLAMLFQALRIEVNGELEALKLMLSQAVSILKPEGRICVISYHSLEDRLVKNFFKAGNFEGVIEKDFYGNSLAPLTPVTRKPVTPSEQELMMNSRSRSAKLRIAELTKKTL